MVTLKSKANTRLAIIPLRWEQLSAIGDGNNVPKQHLSDLSTQQSIAVLLLNQENQLNAHLHQPGYGAFLLTPRDAEQPDRHPLGSA